MKRACCSRARMSGASDASAASLAAGTRQRRQKCMQHADAQSDAHLRRTQAVSSAKHVAAAAAGDAGRTRLPCAATRCTPALDSLAPDDTDSAALMERRRRAHVECSVRFSRASQPASDHSVPPPLRTAVTACSGTCTQGGCPQECGEALSAERVQRRATCGSAATSACARRCASTKSATSSASPSRRGLHACACACGCALTLPLQRLQVLLDGNFLHACQTLKCARAACACASARAL